MLICRRDDILGISLYCMKFSRDLHSFVGGGGGGGGVEEGMLAFSAVLVF